MKKGIRGMLLILGSILAAFGISCCLTAGLGVDPVTVLIDGLSVSLGLSVGVAAMVNSGLILFAFFIIDRSYIKIGTFISIFLFGNGLNVFSDKLAILKPYMETSIWIPYLVLFIGMFCAGVGFATCIAAHMGPSAPDIPVLFLCDRFKLPMKYSKMLLDAIFTAAGYLLGGIVGIGTILCIFCIGYVYQLTNQFLEKRLNIEEGI